MPQQDNIKVVVLSCTKTFNGMPYWYTYINNWPILQIREQNSSRSKK